MARSASTRTEAVTKPGKHNSAQLNVDDDWFNIPAKRCDCDFDTVVRYGYAAAQ